MTGRDWPRNFPSPGTLAAFGVMGCALGTAIDGSLSGAQAGLAAGLALPFLPLIASRTSAALCRPDGLPRFVARQIAAGVVTAAARLLRWLERFLGPLAAVLDLLLLPLRFAADLVAGLAGVVLARCGRAVSTPLGMANLAALAILIGDAAGVQVFSLATPLGLLALVLTLMVSEGERRDAAGNAP